MDFDTKTFSKIKLYYIKFLTKHVGPWYFSFDKSFGQKNSSGLVIRRAYNQREIFVTKLTEIMSIYK